MFCNQCGAKMNDGAKFCPQCGYSTSTPEPVKNKVVKKPTAQKKTKGAKTFVRGFLSTLCCIMIFVFLFTTLSLFTARSIIGPNNIKNILNNLPVAKIVVDTPIEGIIGDMDSQKTEKAYYETGIKNYVKKVTLEYSTYLLGGEKPNGVNGREIVKIMRNEQGKFEKIIGNELKSSNFEEIENFFADEENVGFLSPQVKTAPELDAIRIILSYYVIIAMLFLTLLFVFLLFLTRNYRIDSFVWTSVPVILASVILAICFALKPIIVLFLEEVEQKIIDIANIFLDGLLLPVLIITGTTLVIGIIFILVYVITTKIKKSSKNKKAEAKVGV